MKWFSEFRTPLIAIGNYWYIRLRQFYVFLVTIAGVLVLHSDLLHLGENWNDRLILVCFVLLALNHSVVEKQ